MPATAGCACSPTSSSITPRSSIRGSRPRARTAARDTADFYVWSDDPDSVRGTARDNWTYDERAGQYYLHRFAPFQPDLDITNPAVRHEIAKSVGFWLKLGVSGFRMDAVPFLCEEVGTPGLRRRPR